LYGILDISASCGFSPHDARDPAGPQVLSGTPLIHLSIMCTYKVEQKVDLLGVHFKFYEANFRHFPSFSIIAVVFFAL